MPRTCFYKFESCTHFSIIFFCCLQLTKKNNQRGTYLQVWPLKGKKKRNMEYFFFFLILPRIVKKIKNKKKKRELTEWFKVISLKLIWLKDHIRSNRIFSAMCKDKDSLYRFFFPPLIFFFFCLVFWLFILIFWGYLS